MVVRPADTASPGVPSALFDSTFSVDPMPGTSERTPPDAETDEMDRHYDADFDMLPARRCRPLSKYNRYRSMLETLPELE